MNALAGWGFASAQALEQALGARRCTQPQGDVVKREELEHWMAFRTSVPSRDEVIARWRCSRAAAYRHRATCARILAKRERA